MNLPENIWNIIFKINFHFLVAINATETSIQRVISHFIANTYPNNFGLNSFNILGNVKCVRNVPWPPMHHETPRFSMSTSHSAAEFAAVALVNESPTAPIISMSPIHIIITVNQYHNKSYMNYFYMIASWQCVMMSHARKHDAVSALNIKMFHL